MPISKNSKLISVNEKTLNEFRDLVDHEEEDSNTVILKKVILEFNIMSECLRQNNMLSELHPEWKYDSKTVEQMEEFDRLNFRNINKIFDKKE